MLEILAGVLDLIYGSEMPTADGEYLKVHFGKSDFDHYKLRRSRLNISMTIFFTYKKKCNPSWKLG